MTHKPGGRPTTSSAGPAAAALDDQLHTLFLAFQKHFRAGDLDEAERLVRARLALAPPGSPAMARALTNLGLVLHRRAAQEGGDFDAAESALMQALAISERLGDEEATARDLGNLSLVPESRGDLDRAQALCRRALAIAERIGADHIAATKYANLGDMALVQGRPTDAAELWTRAIALFEKLAPTDPPGRPHWAAYAAEFTRKRDGLPPTG